MSAVCFYQQDVCVRESSIMWGEAEVCIVHLWLLWSSSVERSGQPWFTGGNICCTLRWITDVMSLFVFVRGSPRWNVKQKMVIVVLIFMHQQLDMHLILIVWSKVFSFPNVCVCSGWEEDLAMCFWPKDGRLLRHEGLSEVQRVPPG